MENNNLIYIATVENVRELKKTLKYIKRKINEQIRVKKADQISPLTKVYLLTYSTWVESNLLKLVHIPDSFSTSEINQIKSQSKIEDKWVKLLELVFRKFNLTKKGSEVPNKKKKIKRLIDKYILRPSLLRNKIIHGQWHIAFNRENTSINNELTDQIKNVDFVQIYIWVEVSELIFQIIEDLVKARSRNKHKAHYKNYHQLLAEIEAFEEKTKNWSVESKKEVLARKMRKK